jgi:hypothetical protein
MTGVVLPENGEALQRTTAIRCSDARGRLIHIWGISDMSNCNCVWRLVESLFEVPDRDLSALFP